MASVNHKPDLTLRVQISLRPALESALAPIFSMQSIVKFELAPILRGNSFPH